MEITAKLLIGQLPNYLMLDLESVGLRQDGMKERPKVDVAHLTDEEVDQYLTEYENAFRAHVANRRLSAQEKG